MEAHAERLKRHRPQLHLLPREAVEKHPIALLGTFCGLAGGLLLALPLVIYDWAKASHAALELPMAVSAWLFGLNHFDQNGYLVWAIIVGAVILLAYWRACGRCGGPGGPVRLWEYSGSDLNRAKRPTLQLS